MVLTILTTAAQCAKHFPNVHVLLQSLPQPLMVDVISILQVEKRKPGLPMEDHRAKEL